MRGVRRSPLRSWVALLALVFMWLGTLTAKLDAVRTVHEYCADHQVIEHREPGDLAESESESESDGHVPCDLAGVALDEPPAPPAIVGVAIVEHPLPPPLPPALGGGPRAPPLRYAPKTSPPSDA